MTEINDALWNNVFTTFVNLVLSVIVSFWPMEVSLHSTTLLPATTISVCQSGPPQCDYQTIQDAIDAANDGDMVLVYPGAYEGRVTLRNKVALKSSDGPQVTTITAVEGPIVTAGNILSATVQGFTIDGQDTLTNVVGIESTNCDLIVANCIVENLHGVSRPGDMHAIAIRSTGVGSLIVTGTTIQNIIGSVYYYDGGDAIGIWIEGETQANITETTIERLSGGDISPCGHGSGGYAVGIRTQGADLTISDSKITEVVGGESWYQRAVSCTPCKSSNGPSIGVEVTEGSLILRDSVFTSFPFERGALLYAILTSDASAVILERNIIALSSTAADYKRSCATTARSLLTPPCDPCIPLWSKVVAVRASSGSRLRASDNFISENSLHDPFHQGDGVGLAAGISLYWIDEVILSRNLIANVSSDGGEDARGIQIDHATTAKINANVVHTIHGGNAVGIGLTNVTEAVVANNIVQSITGSPGDDSNKDGDDATGLFISQGSGVIQNNTFHQTTAGLAESEGQPGKAAGLRVTDGANVQAVNNVLIDHGVGVSSVSPYALSSDYNDFWDNELDYEGVSPGANDLHVNPSFVDAQNGDFHLTWDSPLIDAGTNAVVIPEDFEGDPRPLDGDDDGDSVTDIGADEYWSDLRGSTKTVDQLIAASGDTLAYQLILVNPSSRHDRIGVMMTDTLPIETTYVEGSLEGTAGTWRHANGVITWTGTISAEERITLTLDVIIDENLEPCALTNRAILDDQIGKVYTLQATTLVNPWKRYFPLVFRSLP